MFRALRADEIELRVGTVSKTGTGFSLLCYKDARCDQNILDEVYGSEYWQRDHKEVKGNLYGGVGVYNKELKEWIWKWDCGVESFTESQKGEASDSFKRACFNLGIGRELYTSPFIWISGHIDPKSSKPETKFVSGLRVSLIEYEETDTKRTIKKLQIKDKDGNVVFNYGIAGATKEAPKLNRSELEDKIVALCDAKGLRLTDICKKAKVNDLSELDEERLQNCIEYINKVVV